MGQAQQAGPGGTGLGGGASRGRSRGRPPPLPTLLRPEPLPAPHLHTFASRRQGTGPFSLFLFGWRRPAPPRRPPSYLHILAEAPPPPRPPRAAALPGQRRAAREGAPRMRAAANCEWSPRRPTEKDGEGALPGREGTSSAGWGRALSACRPIETRGRGCHGDGTAGVGDPLPRQPRVSGAGLGLDGGRSLGAALAESSGFISMRLMNINELFAKSRSSPG